jgi:L-lysine 2,3-aminomutase
MKPLMITPDAPTRHLEPWRQELAGAVTDAGELLELLGLDPALLSAARKAARLFGLRVPHSYIARMRPGDPDDPLLRQVLPLAAELEPARGFGADPVGDLAAVSVPGVLSKYHGRALLVTTGACAVHCRYCFRREYPYPAGTLTPARLESAVDTLAADPALEEVILSGGDPLSLPTHRLARLTTALGRLPRLRRLRIHTRTPVVLPARVDAALLGWLRALPWRSVVVLHVNHPRELSEEVARAAAALADAGASLLNQSVLLRGVNDDADTLVELSQRLFDAGIQPYYLHLLDKVSGTAHFDVPEPEACALQAQLMARLPGYLVPRMVRELAGAPSKTPLDAVRERADRC